MKIANKIEVNSRLVLLFSLLGLLIIDIIVVPWYLTNSYFNDFRAKKGEVFEQFITFALNYNGPKVYLIGDSVFRGDPVNKQSVIAHYFEKCYKKETFNFALGGAYVKDIIPIINHTDDTTLKIVGVNPYFFRNIRSYGGLDILNTSNTKKTH